MRCLICGLQMDTCVCARCKYDLSSCCECFPTLVPVPAGKESIGAVRERIYTELLEQVQRKSSVQVDLRESQDKEICACGNKNTATNRYCEACGKRNPLFTVPSKKRSFSLSQNLWICDCGNRNTLSAYYCGICGRENPILKEKHLRDVVLSLAKDGENWVCSCGSSNPLTAQFCTECGCPKQLNRKEDWKCSCGAYNAPIMKYCTNCGEEKKNAAETGGLNHQRY